jgi:hypothetical protein
MSRDVRGQSRMNPDPKGVKMERIVTIKSKSNELWHEKQIWMNSDAKCHNWMNSDAKSQKWGNSDAKGQIWMSSDVKSQNWMNSDVKGWNWTNSDVESQNWMNSDVESRYRHLPLPHRVPQPAVRSVRASRVKKTYLFNKYPRRFKRLMCL